jgi:hypothetical protein
MDAPATLAGAGTNCSPKDLPSFDCRNDAVRYATRLYVSCNGEARFASPEKQINHHASFTDQRWRRKMMKKFCQRAHEPERLGLGMKKHLPAWIPSVAFLCSLLSHASPFAFFSFAELLHNLFHLILRDSHAVGHTVARDRAQVRQEKLTLS